MHKKILSTFLILLFVTVIANLTQVYGVGIVSHAWVNGTGDDRYLLFRTYSGAASSEIQKYNGQSGTKVGDGWKYSYGGKNKDSKWISWVDNSGKPKDIPLPTTNPITFLTYGFIFHTQPLGSYTLVDSKGDDTYGYNKLNLKAGSLDSVLNNVSNVITNSSRGYLKLNSKWTDYSEVITDKKYTAPVIYSIIAKEGSYFSWSDGKLQGYSFNKASKQITYRHAIMQIPKNTGRQIYIEDKIIYNSDLQNIIKKANNATEIYVSNVVVTYSPDWTPPELGSKKLYHICLTVNDFFDTPYVWGDGNKGIASDDQKAIAAVANLFDNKIVLPNTSKRTVLVRHIDIGTNTTISTDIIKNSKRLTPSQTERTISVTNPTGTKTGTNTSSKTYTLAYEEYYEDMVDINQAITKNALTRTEYNCVGYNIAVNTNKTSAETAITNLIKSKSMESGTSVTVPAKSLSDSSDYVVMDFYYSTYDREVEVNHLYVDKDGKVLNESYQTITPNSTAKSGNTTINRTNTDTTIVEKYIKTLGNNLKTQKAQTLISGATCVGYETFTTNPTPASLAGTQRTIISGEEYTFKSDTDANKNIKQVNYYYKVSNTVEVNHLYVDKDGKVIAEAYQTIIPNETAKSGEARINNAETIVEEYTKYLGKTIQTGIATQLLAGVTYKGYETFTDKPTVASLVGQTRTNLNTATTYTFSANNEIQSSPVKQVNYYYYLENEIEVNHLYIDEDGIVLEVAKQTIVPNNSAKSGNTTINRTNNDKTIVEIYNKFLGQAIQTGVSTNINKNIVEYKGYEIFDYNPDVQTLVNTERTDLNTSTTYTFSAYNELSDPVIKQVNYYYYKEREVEVNHLYVDEDGIVLAVDKQTIKPNETALSGDQTINRLNSDKTVVERYQKQVNKNLQTKKVTKIASNVEYKGYETFKSYPDVNSLVGTQRTDLNKATTYTFKSDTINNKKIKQVNYYYYLDNRQQEEPPPTNIEGELFVEPLEQPIGQCSDDGESIYVTSIPSGTTAKVGIKDIPKLKLGALETKYVSVAGRNHTIDLDIVLKYGNQSVTVSYEDIPYKTGYYIITDMAVYELIKSTIYDAGHGYNGTSGNSLFTWSSGKKEINQDGAIGVQRLGIDNKTITKSNENNLDSYFKMELVDKNNKSTKLSLNAENQYVVTYNNRTAFERIVGSATNRYSNDKIIQNLGLRLRITAQNMLVKVNNTMLGEVTNNRNIQNYQLIDYINMETKPIVRTQQTVIPRTVYDKIGNSLLTKEDYTNSNTIDKSVLNGERLLAGKSEYKAQVLLGNKTLGNIQDTTYYAAQSSPDIRYIFSIVNSKLSKDYKVNNSAGVTQPSVKYKEVKPINVYTPITVSATLASNKNVLVNQTQQEGVNTSIIQLKVPFTITFDSSEPERGVYNISNTTKYSKGYYVKFDFDVHNVYVNGVLYKKGNVIKAGTWIGMVSKKSNGKATVTATVNESKEGVNIAENEIGKYTVRAVAYNATNSMLTESVKYSILNEIIQGNNSLKDMIANICKNPSYFAEKEYGVAILNRAYDFRVTDLSDVNWKNVFRRNSSGLVNTHTGNLYYAGVSKWRNTSEKLNEIISRTTYEIGRNPLRILPIGPYKNTDTTYVGAPKLGYKFSYDLKVSGSYYKADGTVRTDKKVQIETKFYYISKDGKTYLPEYTGSGEGIYLFYKTSNGKYVRIGATGGDYQISMTPNDGYRYIEDTDRKYLSTKSLVIGNLRKLTLTYKTATPVDKEEAITYYGEYKLPNSTIAVKVDKDGKYNINSPLKNGYIGVVFDIVAYSGTATINGKAEDIVLSYSKDSKVNSPNTSQWDYEGFLGYTGYGKEVKKGTLNMKLEKGVWNITNKAYNDIKGSVILYDMDKRADTDYE